MIPEHGNTSEGPEQGYLTVSEVTSYIKGLINSNPLLSRLSVCGEVSGFVRHSSGHVYFSLKDENALIRCVFFRGNQKGDLDFLKEGAQIALAGELGIFEKRGEYQIYVRDVRDFGRGQILLRIEQLKKKYEAMGYFSLERKKAIPDFPVKIGIVTAPQGAALQDMLNVFRKKKYPLEILIAESRVQGDGASTEIARAIKILDQLRPDLIIIARGGGSFEDLLCFSDPEVIEAVYAAKTPVISGVGHEVDFTLVDHVADVRAATPTQAAETACPDGTEICQLLLSSAGRMASLSRKKCENSKKQLNQISPERLMRCLSQSAARKQQWLDNLQLRLCNATEKSVSRVRNRVMSFSAVFPVIIRKIGVFRDRVNFFSVRLCRSLAARRIEKEKTALLSAMQKLRLLNPENILKRGFTMVRYQGKLIRSRTDLKPGEQVDIIFCDGQRKMEVCDE